IGMYYNGHLNMVFLWENITVVFIFRCLVVVLVFVVAFMKTETLWSTADVFMSLLAIVNLVAIIGLSNIAFAVMNDYQRERKAGKKPVFKPEELEINLFGIESWGMKKK